MIHVVLCDDHAILRRGIRDTLAEATDINVTAEAGSYAELREQLRTAACDVLLLDINMPGRSGLEVLASVRETHPQIRVVMVSMYPEDQYALRSIKAGAAGYAKPAAPIPHEMLSEREMQTLLKIASGQKQTDIAQELMLSPKTVSVYRARVLEKLGMSSNAELTAYAIYNKLI